MPSSTSPASSTTSAATTCPGTSRSGRASRRRTRCSCARPTRPMPDWPGRIRRMASRARLWRAWRRATHLPAPEALRLTWPTEFRNYTQFYGERQQSYYTTSVAHSLHGGHNGVDLHVLYSDPSNSPIRACLDGVVTEETHGGDRLRPPRHHRERGARSGASVTAVRPHDPRCRCEEGQPVHAGEVLGIAGVTGATTGPHLHLSLKIDGLKLPANADHLNPRPYLDPLPPPRGRPRSRTRAPTSSSRREPIAPGPRPWSRRAGMRTAGLSAAAPTTPASATWTVRRVVAVNPGAWGDDLAAFFATHYPGVAYCAAGGLDSPETLKTLSGGAPAAYLPDESRPWKLEPSRGAPRSAPTSAPTCCLPPEAHQRLGGRRAARRLGSAALHRGGQRRRCRHRRPGLPPRHCQSTPTPGMTTCGPSLRSTTPASCTCRWWPRAQRD